MGFLKPYWKYIGLSAPLGAIIGLLSEGDVDTAVVGFVAFPIGIITALLLSRGAIIFLNDVRK